MNYPGGKGGCYHHIINLMPPHDTYIETHLGGGNILERKAPARCSIGIDVDAAVIALWNTLKEFPSSGYTFINDDAGSVIKAMAITGDTLIYSDPPYLLSTRKSGPRYKHEMTDKQHEAWLAILKGLDCPVILSGYKSEMYMDTLKGWFYKEFQAKTRRGMATESVWCNYRPQGRMHDYRYVGENFRERERIKRKSGRWLKNFKGLSPAERYSIYESIAHYIVTDGEATCDIVVNGDRLRPTSSHPTSLDRNRGGR